MDRELDKQIAGLMGWVDFWEGRDGFREYLMGYPPNEQAMGIEGERAPVPFYSTEIGAAWEVVEHFVQSGHVFAVKGDGLRTYEAALPWTVLVDRLPRIDDSTAPLAICRAALAAAHAGEEEGKG